MVVPNTPNPTKDKLLVLMTERDAVERRINQYGEILNMNGNVGMEGSLLDSEQFPRNDIDVYAVRNARQQIIMLQNDHKQLMLQIEALLHQLHGETAQQQQQQELARKTDGMHLHDLVEMPNSSGEADLPLDAFAKIGQVVTGSPAAHAGLRADDLLLEFGSVNTRNFKNNLNMIQSVVQNMQNRTITVKVKRGEDLFCLNLMPRIWSGRGLLGCNIVLLDAVER